MSQPGAHEPSTTGDATHAATGDGARPDAPSAEAQQPPRQEPVQALAQGLAANSGLKRNEQGNIDVLASVGGARGLVESLAPGLVFLGLFIGTRSLNIALIGAIAVGVVLLGVRLISRQQVTPAITGLVGIVICALFARVGGEARDYYVPGFWISGAYLAAMVVSIAVRWPLVGLIFGMIRGEGIEWRQDRSRVRIYTAATWLVAGVFVARLLVQVPLYFADNVTALGTARLAMGVPLYVGALALAWIMSRPAAPVPDATETTGETRPPASGSEDA